MVVGDVVMSTKIRPYENATITKVDISIHEKTNKKGVKRKETRSSYTATFADGTSFIFYGFNINKSDNFMGFYESSYCRLNTRNEQSI